MLAAGFFVLAWGAANASATDQVSPAWLVVTYFLHTVGELALSPVGLSSITKLSPVNRVGQMMGIWFFGAATGNFIGGRVGGLFESFPLNQIFLAVFGTSLAAALVMFFLVPWMKRLTGEAKS